MKRSKANNQYPMASRLFKLPINRAKNYIWILRRYYFTEAKLAAERGRPYCKHNTSIPTYVHE